MPHRYGCRHCEMVESYRLQREADIQRLETVECMDNGERPVTFREWLTSYTYESPELYGIEV